MSEQRRVSGCVSRADGVLNCAKSRRIVPTGSSKGACRTDPEIRARRAPRYTSYPTTPHFSAAVGMAEYEGWLAALPASAKLSLYLHVPYCRTMCWYCGCQTKIVARDEPVAAFMTALGREVELAADRLPERMSVQSVH